MSPTHAPPNPVRLTREQNRAATRGQLIESAITLIADGGVAAASLDQIAENAGFSRGAFHSNFVDKRELMQAVVDTIAHRAHDLLESAVAGASTSDLKLAAYIRVYMSFIARHPRDARALVEVVSQRHASGTESYECRARGSLDTLITLLSEGQRNGQMRDFDVILMALLIRASLDTQVRHIGASPTQLELAADELVRTFELATRDA